MHPLIVPGSSQRFDVTIGFESSSFGYQVSGPAFGAISPGTFKGPDILVARTVASIDDFNFVLNGTVPQNFFRSLIVQTSSGHFLGADSVSPFLSANASTFSTGGGVSTWRWAWTNVFDPWETAGDGTRFMLITL